MTSPSDIVQLPVDERLKYMEALWESLRPTDPESPDWHGRVLSARRSKIERGEAQFITGKELKDRLNH